MRGTDRHYCYIDFSMKSSGNIDMVNINSAKDVIVDDFISSSMWRGCFDDALYIYIQSKMKHWRHFDDR